MRRYFINRLLLAVPIVLAIVLLNFVLTRIMPGDPVTAVIGDFPVSPEYEAQVREQLGLDQPMSVQLVKYLQALVQGDLGYSFANRQPVLDLLLVRMGRSLMLMLPALSVATVTGVLLARWAAKHEDKLPDRVATSLSVLGVSLPSFWIAQILVLVFAVWMGILPAYGMSNTQAGATGWAAIVDTLRHMVLPGACVALFYIATISRVSRAKIVDEARQDYITTAIAKGIGPKRVMNRHAMRNALIPIVTVAGNNFSHAVTGAILIETVFAWPGVGGLFINAIASRDYAVLSGIFLVSSISVVFVNLLVDMSYAVLDPRVRRAYASAG